MHSNSQTSASFVDQILEALPEIIQQLTVEEQKIAMQIYRGLATGKPISVNKISNLSGINEINVNEILANWPAVYYDDEKAIVGFWGLGLGKMAHRLYIDDTRVYPWCAWDAIFIPQLIGKQGVIESLCPVTKSKIQITVNQDGSIAEADQEIYVSFITPEKSRIMDDVITNLCHYIYFFSSKKAGEEYTSKHENTFLLSLEQVEELSKKKNHLQFKDVL